MFQTRRFIDEGFGGVRSLHEALANHAPEPPSMEVVAKWRQRDAIPGPWLPICLAVLERIENRVVSVTEYMNDGGGTCLHEKLGSTGPQQSVFE